MSELSVVDYETLVMEKKTLQQLLKGQTLPHHRVFAENRLKQITETIKQAHKARYERELIGKRQ